MRPRTQAARLFNSRVLTSDSRPTTRMLCSQVPDQNCVGAPGLLSEHDKNFRLFNIFVSAPVILILRRPKAGRLATLSAACVTCLIKNQIPSEARFPHSALVCHGFTAPCADARPSQSTAPPPSSPAAHPIPASHPRSTSVSRGEEESSA